jgi:hypothetical protein
MRDMGFFKSKKGSIISDYFQLHEQLGQFRQGDMVDVALYDDHLEISSGKHSPITLPYNRITDVFYGMQDEIVETNKSVIGRAVAGGILFGGVGAIVGAASGTGTKRKAEKTTIFVISYTDKNGEAAYLQFTDTRQYKGRKIAKMLDEFCGLEKNRNIITEL